MLMINVHEEGMIGQNPSVSMSNRLHVVIFQHVTFMKLGYIVRLVLRVRSSFCSTQPSTQVPSLIFTKCCHVGIHVILET
jgi:hypothetical protein